MNANVTKSKRQILWAFDPRQNPADAKNIVKELKTWARHLKCEVQPVTIVAENFITAPVELMMSEIEFQNMAKRISDRYIKKTGVAFLPPLTIFKNALTSRGAAVQFANFAASVNPIMIMVNTRAKKMKTPFRIGGFAETLASTSKVPVLLLNQHAVPSQKIPSVLFPTDFSREATNALGALTPFLKAFHSKLHLFNQVPNPLSLYWDYSFAQQVFDVVPEEIVLKTKEANIEHGRAWTEAFDKEGIVCSPLIKNQKKNLVSDILENAKITKAGLIAMVSHRGTLSQDILGSTLRDVIVEAKCPVLVFNRPGPVPHAKKQKVVRSNHPAVAEILNRSESRP